MLYPLSVPFVCSYWIHSFPTCILLFQFISSVAQSCLILCSPMYWSTHASLSITNSRSLLKLMFIESMMPSNHLILICPHLLPPSIFHSIRVFSNESVLRIRWPKYWTFSFSISPSNEYYGLIAFRIDWLDLLAFHRTLKSLFQHHSSKHQFFAPQFSLRSNSHIYPYMTTGKTIGLIKRTFVGKVMSLLFEYAV